MTGSGGRAPRLEVLDSLRGLAALLVLFAHMSLAFAPRFNGQRSPDVPHVLFGSPLYALVNGTAAVIVFFVLSGFVLTNRFFLSGTMASIPDAILKRWPRLAFPVMISSLMSGVFMALGWYCNGGVVSENGSVWLAGLFPWPSGGVVEIGRSLLQGAVTTFVSGDSSYNSSFWTMHFELLGSMLAFVLTICLLPVLRRFPLPLVLAGMGILWLRELWRFPYMACFIMGMILALIHARYPGIRWRGMWSQAAALVAVVLLTGYGESQENRPYGFYAFLGPLAKAMGLSFEVLLYTAASVLLISAALWSPLASSWLGHPRLTALGRLSFPIYLLHVPILCSAGCGAYLLMNRLGGGSAPAMMAGVSVTAGITLLLALPLASLDDWWLDRLRKFRPLQGLFRKPEAQIGEKS